MKPLLPNISTDLAETINKLSVKRVYAADQEIFAEGEKAKFLPIVVSGKVKMIRYLEPGKEVIIGIFETGEMFAVPPVFDGGTYPATATAMEKTQLLLIGRRDFLELLRESSEFSFAVIKWMCLMLREKTATIRNLATASPEHRVGTIILRLAENASISEPARITLRREDIAKMAGLTTETTIRVVRRMAAKGFIKIIHGKIAVETVEPLQHFLES
jgi:cAMP-binding proteins - catabolite gene activator and regulatory subunit of cAMP-dependent protein kinases